MERLTRSKKWDEFQTRMGINPNSTNTQFELAAGGQTTGNKARTNNEQQQSNQNYTINMLSAMEKYDAGGAPTSEVIFHFFFYAYSFLTFQRGVYCLESLAPIIPEILSISCRIASSRSRS